MAHTTNEKNQGIVEQGGTEPFDITFLNRAATLGGVPTNPDGYVPGPGPEYADPSAYVTVVIKIYDSATNTLIPVPVEYTAPTLVGLKYNGSTGNFIVTVEGGSATPSADLGENHAWALVWTAVINGATVTDLATAELITVVVAGGASHGTALYCTVSDISKFMTGEKFTFGANTPHTVELVESFIKAASDEIDAITHRSWRPRISRNEMREVARGYSPFWGNTSSFKVKYSNYQIQAIHKLELWNGSGYVDITDAEGRNKKWYYNPAVGIIYIRTGLTPLFYRNGVRITYTYGETELPNNIKMAAILLSAWYVLQSEDYTLLFPEGSEHMRISEKQEIWKQRAMDLLGSERRGMVWS